MRAAKASAPGNIFLGGEHSVVYFEPAIVAAIGYRTVAEARKSGDDRVVINSREYGTATEKLGRLKKRRWKAENANEGSVASDYRNDSNPALAPLKDLVGEFARVHDLEEGIRLDISSAIPRKSGGMSSSTAVLASVYAALKSLYGMEINPEEFFRELYPFQVKIHGGSASGAEIVSSSFGGYNMVRKTESEGMAFIGERTNLGHKIFHLVIGDTCIEARTDIAVKKVREGWNADRKRYNGYFRAIGKIVEEEARLIKEGDVEGLGKMMNENHIILAENLEVSSPELDRLVDAARKAGAAGAKLSGGGMGGVMIALAKDAVSQKKVAKAVQDAGGKAYITTVGGRGVEVEA
jgi:mevalonate kinase